MEPVVGQLERMQVVKRQEGVALDAIDRVVAQVEDLQEVQVLEHAGIDARQLVVRQIEDDQADQAEKRGLVDALATEPVIGQVQHQQLFQLIEHAPR